MSEVQRSITPFETGVCAALGVVGVFLAALAPDKREGLEDTVKKLISALPADNSLIGNRSEHHIALEALIANIFPERKG